MLDGNVLNEMSPFFRLDLVDGSDTILVVFSHIGYPSGKFALSNELAEIKVTKLFLNCHENSWYQAGIPGFSNSIDDTCLKLTKIISSLNCKKLISTGMSMGGYAAILFGLKLKCDSILVFTAETTIGDAYTRSYFVNGLKFYDFRYRTLAGLINSNSKTKITAIYGCYDLIDLSLLWPIASEVESANLFRLFMVSGDHQVTLRLKISMLVNLILKEHQIIDKGQITKEFTTFSNFTLDEIYLYLEIHRLKELKDSKTIYKTLVDNAITRTRPNLSLWCGTAAYDLGQLDKARAILDNGIHLDKQSHEMHHTLGITLFALGDFEESKNIFSRAIELRPNAWMTHYRHASACEAIGDINGAQSSYKMALHYNPNHYESRSKIRL